MPRRLTQLQHTMVEAVYETIASMLPPGSLCEQIFIPTLIRGLDLQDDPQVAWDALRDLMSMGLIRTRLVQDISRVSPKDRALLMRGPQIAYKRKDGKDEWLPIGFVSLASSEICGRKGCAINADMPDRYPPVCCVDKLTEADLEVIRIATSQKSSQAQKEASTEQAKAREAARKCHLDLRDYNLIAVNSSGGKDSQAMLDAVMHKCCELGIQDRVRVFHADLKDIEWSGSREVAKLQADHYGVPFTATSNERFDDLLDHVSDRGEWPSGGQQSRQYCTADMKRQPINRLFTAFSNEWWQKVEADMLSQLRQILGGQAEVDKARGLHTKNPRSISSTYKRVMKSERGKEIDLADFRPKILNCIGVRAQESPARAKKSPLTLESSIHGSSGEKRVDTWFPIFTWTRRQVWEVILASGVPHHWAYNLGMSRLSCVFCVMGNQAALAIGAEYNPALFERYLALEDELRARDPIVCGSTKTKKQGCVLTAKAKRAAQEKGRAFVDALDEEGACPLDYEPGPICVPNAEELKAWKEGRRASEPTVTPARTRQWRFAMQHSIREVAERIARCKQDPTREECAELLKTPDSDSFL